MQINLQLGKNKLTDGFIKGLKNTFTNSQNVKITVLKSACRDREELKEIKDKILNELGKNYTARIIGYTIFIKKWRKSKQN